MAFLKKPIREELFNKPNICIVDSLSRIDIMLDSKVQFITLVHETLIEINSIVSHCLLLSQSSERVSLGILNNEFR